MSDDIIFYTNPMSRGRVVRWMLEEVGQPYTTEVLDFRTGMKTPKFLAINPMGKVPVIRHGDTIVTEGAAICAYLADAFPQTRLAPPPGDRRRGAYYRWLFFAAGPLEAAATNKALGFEVPPDRRGMSGYGSLDTTLDTLEQEVRANEFVAGSDFSAADVYVGSHIGWGMMFGTIEKRPAFEAYWGRISSRHAAQRARDIDDALLPPEQRMGGKT